MKIALPQGSVEESRESSEVCCLPSSVVRFHGLHNNIYVFLRRIADLGVIGTRKSGLRPARRRQNTLSSDTTKFLEAFLKQPSRIRSEARKKISSAERPQP